MNSKLIIALSLSLLASCATVEPYKISPEEMARREENFRAALASGYRPDLDGGAARGQAQIIQGLDYTRRAWAPRQPAATNQQIPMAECHMVSVQNLQTGMYDLVKKCD